MTSDGRLRLRMNLAGVDLNLLVALDALLSERNVTRAAARIGRSQPATSHALNRARELFRDPLLVRVGGGLALTARARVVAPQIHRLLRELGAVLDARKELDPNAIESVTIASTDYVGFVLLPSVFAILQQAAPRMSVRVRTAEGPDALESVVGGVVDLAIGTFPQIPAGLRTEELFEDQFVCLRRRRGGPTRAPATAPKMSLDDFARLGHVLVASPGAGLGPVDHALARKGRSRHVAAYVPHFLVAPSIVAATDLVLTTGRRIARRMASMHDLELFECPVALRPFAIRLVWHPRTDDDSVGKWLRALVRQAVTRLTDEARDEKRKRTRA